MKPFILSVLFYLVSWSVSAQCTTPIITASGPTTFCSGNSVTLSAPVTGNTWTQKANFGGPQGQSAVGFSIDNKGISEPEMPGQEPVSGNMILPQTHGHKKPVLEAPQDLVLLVLALVIKAIWVPVLMVAIIRRISGSMIRLPITGQERQILVVWRGTLLPDSVLGVKVILVQEKQG